MLIGDFSKQPAEKLRKGINFAGWLYANETIASYTVSVVSEDGSEAPAQMTIADDGDGSEIATGGQSLMLRFDGGTDGVSYIATVKATTSAPFGQLKEVELRVAVQEE